MPGGKKPVVHFEQKFINRESPSERKRRKFGQELVPDGYVFRRVSGKM